MSEISMAHVSWFKKISRHKSAFGKEITKEITAAVVLSFYYWQIYGGCILKAISFLLMVTLSLPNYSVKTNLSFRCQKVRKDLND